jgi:hypothetical protein
MLIATCFKSHHDSPIVLMWVCEVAIFLACELQCKFNALQWPPRVLKGSLPLANSVRELGRLLATSTYLSTSTAQLEAARDALTLLLVRFT